MRRRTARRARALATMLCAVAVPLAGTAGRAQPGTGVPLPSATMATPMPVPPGSRMPDLRPAPPGGAGTYPTAAPNLVATPASTRALVLPPVPALPRSVPAFSPLLPSGGIVGADQPFVGITSRDAVAMALARNTNLAVSQSNRRIAHFGIVSAEGAYDVSLQLQPSYSYQARPSISSFQSGPGGGPDQITNLGGTLSASALNGAGGRVTGSTSANRIDDNLTLNSYDPYYETSIALMYTQPLARNRAIDVERERLLVSRINLDLQGDAALLQASQTIDTVLVAYDDLVQAWRNLGIQEDALRQAKAQSESNVRLVRRGEDAPIDVVQSDEQVNEFQDAVYSAVQGVATQQNQLKSQILGDPADPVWTANLVPTTPLAGTPPEPALDAVIVAALANRPEVAQLRDSIRTTDVDLRFAQDQTKPQIDLSAGVTENGFAGALADPNLNPLTSVIGGEVGTINGLVARANAASPNAPPLMPISAGGFDIPPFPGTIGKVGQSYRTAFEGKFPLYQISATLSFPLRNRAAEGQYQEEIEQRRQLAVQEVGLVQRVQYEARNAVQAYRSSRSRLIASGAARLAAERVLASEIRRFRAGVSTTYLVLQRQVQLANARGREVQAQTDVQNAIVEIQRVSGSILTDNDVVLDALGTAREGAVPDLLASPAPAGSPPPPYGLPRPGATSVPSPGYQPGPVALPTDAVYEGAASRGARRPRGAGTVGGR